MTTQASLRPTVAIQAIRAGPLSNDVAECILYLGNGPSDLPSLAHAIFMLLSKIKSFRCISQLQPMCLRIPCGTTRSPTGERVGVIDEALVFTRAPRFRRPHRSHDGQHQLRCSVTPLDFVTKCPARAVIMLSLRSILGGLKLDHDLASTYSDTRVFPLPLLVPGYLQALVQA